MTMVPTGAGSAAAFFDGPGGMAVIADKLFVADPIGQRVLRFQLRY